MLIDLHSHLEGRVRPETAAELERFGMVAVMHPESCGFINWRFEPARWEDLAVRSAWEGLFALARTRSAVACGRT